MYVPYLLKSIQVQGILRFADALKEKEGKIRLIDENGLTHKIMVPEGMMSDIVRPMWEYTVKVTGLWKKEQLD